MHFLYRYEMAGECSVANGRRSVLVSFSVFFTYEKSFQVQWSCQGYFACSLSVFAFEHNVIELKAEDYLHVYMSLLCPYKRQILMLSFLSLQWELGTLTTQVKRHYIGIEAV